MSTPTIRRTRGKATPQPNEAERIWRLIKLRDHLAGVVAAYQAHDIAGATDMLLELWTVEAAIRDLAPSVYQDRADGWLDEDDRLAHSPESPSDRCHICVMDRAV